MEKGRLTYISPSFPIFRLLKYVIWSSSSSWIRKLQVRTARCVRLSLCRVRSVLLWSLLQYFMYHNIAKLFMFWFCSRGKKIEDGNGMGFHSVFLSQDLRNIAYGPLFPSSSFFNMSLLFITYSFSNHLQYLLYHTIAKIFMFCFWDCWIFRESKIVLHPGANAVNYEHNKRHEEYNIGTFIQVKIFFYWYHHLLYS